MRCTNSVSDYITNSPSSEQNQLFTWSPNLEYDRWLNTGPFFYQFEIPCTLQFPDLNWLRKVFQQETWKDVHTKTKFPNKRPKIKEKSVWIKTIHILNLRKQLQPRVYWTTTQPTMWKRFYTYTQQQKFWTQAPLGLEHPLFSSN